MANEINNSSVNSKGKIVIKVVAIAAIAAVLFFLGGPIFRFISTTSASAATFMGDLGACSTFDRDLHALREAFR